ncbi:CheY chemotaxis protein or a CheY-like REC (receiver) domain [Rhizobium sp. NFR07]|uniref:response regulator n=1 Tax=Rhizobium sp. NFR07 TaxID=1566262 RepID=UPI0008EE7BED|nr:response regulator [Rhizobium sp. NFR07]SFB62432.1 CheY chemotaxis protein or a CheY-like REC (receiver) domain [Rhizobium sp. NFR07]
MGNERNTVVLVVEDELFIALELEGGLKADGFRILGPVASVEGAFALLDEQRPDIAVLDFNLGGEKATPIALRLDELGIPFVLASGTDKSELSRYAIFADAQNAGKPTDIAYLSQLLTTTLAAK